jgi:hypothetical protein
VRLQIRFILLLLASLSMAVGCKSKKDEPSRPTKLVVTLNKSEYPAVTHPIFGASMIFGGWHIQRIYMEQNIRVESNLYVNDSGKMALEKICTSPDGNSLSVAVESQIHNVSADGNRSGVIEILEYVSKTSKQGQFNCTGSFEQSKIRYQVTSESLSLTNETTGEISTASRLW